MVVRCLPWRTVNWYCPQRVLKTGPELFSFATALNCFADGLEFGCMGSAAGGTLLITTCVTFGCMGSAAGGTLLIITCVTFGCMGSAAGGILLITTCVTFGCTGSAAGGTLLITTCVTFALRCLSFLKFFILTPWSRVLLENLAGRQLVKKFPAFYGARAFITALTRAHHLSLSWATAIQSIPPPPHHTSWSKPSWFAWTLLMAYRTSSIFYTNKI
jgi:hypothetical protein